MGFLHVVCFVLNFLFGVEMKFFSSVKRAPHAFCKGLCPGLFAVWRA